MTETREPFTPEVTLNTVPVTATRQSAVATYRWPELRLAACTMMLPRPRRMVRSLAVWVVENPERSRSSTTLPSLQLQHGVGILGGADLDAVGQFLARGQHLDSGRQDLIERAVHGLHDGASGVVAVLIDGEPDGKSGGGDHGGGHGPAGGIVDAARRRRGAGMATTRPS